VVLALEMPGVGRDDVEIDLERRVLTIRGRARVTSPEGFRRVYAEYGEGDYERVFTLSEAIDESAIRAEMSNGVLTLTLPRAEAAKPKRIEVKAG
jgi:HSP20 family protein